MAISLLFLLIFSIVGVNYFKGTFASCQGERFDALSPEARQLVFEPTVAPPSWANNTFGEIHADMYVPTGVTGMMTQLPGTEFTAFVGARRAALHTHPHAAHA